MKDAAKFVNMIKLMEFVDLPWEVQSSQMKIVERMTEKLTGKSIDH